MSGGTTTTAILVRFRLRTMWLRLMLRVQSIMADDKRVTLWCQACKTGYASVGEVPFLCPECHGIPYWTTSPPFKLSRNDKSFLKSIRITQDD